MCVRNVLQQSISINDTYMVVKLTLLQDSSLMKGVNVFYVVVLPQMSTMTK